ncbi:MAG: hypothetical protein IJW61_00445 [Clostridia bacterium]|nr:hypothetical protein [Clostridia bacterium]
MYEYKKVTVYQNERYIIDAHSDFGWELYSRQQIHEGHTVVKDVNSRVYTNNNKIYVDTKADTEYVSNNYAVLVFRRNINMPYYKELKSLEESFEASDGYNEFVER